MENNTRIHRHGQETRKQVTILMIADDGTIYLSFIFRNVVLNLSHLSILNVLNQTV